MTNPISFRPTEENLEILNEREAINPNFNRTNFINRSINCYLTNLDRIQEFEGVKRSHERNNTAHEFSMNALFQEKRKANDEFESQLKTSNDKIEQLEVQSTKYLSDIEVLKSKNNFLSTQASALDKKALNELETLRAKVAEQEKDVLNLTAKVSSYENEYLKKAFKEVKGSKLTIQDGKVNETLTVNTMPELVKLLSQKYYQHLFKD
jgi:seryl-tRNA synthetase